MHDEITLIIKNETPQNTAMALDTLSVNYMYIDLFYYLGKVLCWHVKCFTKKDTHRKCGIFLEKCILLHIKFKLFKQLWVSKLKSLKFYDVNILIFEIFKSLFSGRILHKCAFLFYWNELRWVLKMKMWLETAALIPEITVFVTVCVSFIDKTLIVTRSNWLYCAYVLSCIYMIC